MTMRVLLGSDHTTLGEVATVTSGRAAAALSPGRFPKGYPHTDPNEDSVAVADLETHLLLAVADGHNGCAASELAIASLAEAIGSLDLTDPPHALRTLADTIAGSVRTGLARRDSPSRTALTVVLFDAHRGHTFTYGDTWLVRLREGKGRRLNRPGPFLDAQSNPADARFHRLSLRPGDRLLAATDGLADFLGRSALRRLAAIAEQGPEAWVASAVEAALAGGAGDNIGVAFAGWHSDRFARSQYGLANLTGRPLPGDGQS